jgi:hypothetical protein
MLIVMILVSFSIKLMLMGMENHWTKMELDILLDYFIQIKRVRNISIYFDQRIFYFLIVLNHNLF